MDLKTRTEHNEERFVSANFVKSAVIGAMLGGVGFLLYKRLTRQEDTQNNILPLYKRLSKEEDVTDHVIPPIIIKSFEESGEPLEIESAATLQESKHLSGHAGSSFLIPRVYTLPGFDLAKYVRVYRRFTMPAHITPYENDSGLVVKMWLQYKHGGDWLDVDDGPHLIVHGNLPGAPLTCEKLLDDEPNDDNNERPRKRSFNKREKWRIWKVEVDNDAIERESFKKMEIRFYDRDPDHHQ